MKRLLLMVMVLSMPRLVFSNACTSQSCPATAPCDFNSAVWNNCGGTFPQAGDTWTINSGDVMRLDADLTVGVGTINGTLFYDETQTGRTNGRRTLVIRTVSGNDLTIGSSGRLTMRRGDQLYFDTATNGDYGSVSISDGGVLDAQGFVRTTTIKQTGTVTDAAPSGSNCGAGDPGRRWTIPITEGVQDAKVGRRIVFQTGKAHARQLEIVAVSGTDPNGTVTVCTDLTDAKSANLECSGAGAPYACCSGAGTGTCRLGQRLTPHATFGGAHTKLAQQHPEPTISDNSSAYYALPSPGDQIAIVDDVAFGESNGSTFGYLIFGPSAGSNPFPTFKAVNFAGQLADAAGSFIGINFEAKTITETFPDFLYNNLHDYRGLRSTSWLGVQGTPTAPLLYQWNAIHDSQGAGEGQGQLDFQEESNECGCQVEDVLIADNTFYRNQGVSVAVGIGGAVQARRVRLLRNLIYNGCVSASGECGAAQLSSCENCEAAYNVIYDHLNGNGSSGQGLMGSSLTNAFAGTSIHHNWIVNMRTTGLSTYRSAGVTANYVSHAGGNCGDKGRWYGNILKDCGLAGGITGQMLVDPSAMMGNYLVGNTEAVCGSAMCGPGTSCVRQGVQMDNSVTQPSTVQFTDNIIGALCSSAYGGAVYLPDPVLTYNMNIDHLTFDNHSRTSSAFAAVWFDTSAGPGASITVNMRDIAARGNNQIAPIVCSTRANIVDNVGMVYAIKTGVAADDVSTAALSNCSNAGTVTAVQSLGYADDRIISGDQTVDYSLTPTSPLLTAGVQPSGSAVGSRAFRFSTAAIGSVWGNVLPFVGEMPLDFANGNVSNVDSDSDGVIDLHDNCPTKWNPSQYDGDGDGKGDACDSTP